ncbi:MAG: hypothetical protein AB1861_17375 [Cyanobacteriota bacterium]
MNFLRRRINPETFVITRRQLAKYLKIDPSRIWRWEKWKHVLWVHIQGMGGYFISYRQLEQWVAACCTLIRACRDGKALKRVWFAIEQEVTRYTEEAFNRLSEIHLQRLAYLHPL